MYLSGMDYIYKKGNKKMNAIEIKNYVETVAGESADQQVDDYNSSDFFPMSETDKQLPSIMENKNIRDKVGAFADVLWNDEGFLMDHLGDYVYQENSNEDRKNLIKKLSQLAPSSHDAWHNVLAKIEKELISA